MWLFVLMGLTWIALLLGIKYFAVHGRVEFVLGLLVVILSKLCRRHLCGDCTDEPV